MSLTQQLNEIFALAATSCLIHASVNSSLSQQTLQIAYEAQSGELPLKPSGLAILLPEPLSTLELLKENFVFWSTPLQLALRVSLATFISGAIGIFLGLNHAYWGMAAVVVVLNQSYGWSGTTRRAVYRISGTLTGLILAWGVLSLQPQGLWIAFTVALLQLIIELCVALQYAVAAIFIITNALIIAAGGRGVYEISDLFSARALDTIIGCGVAITGFVIMSPRSTLRQINAEIRYTISAAHFLTTLLAQGDKVSPEYRSAMRKML